MDGSPGNNTQLQPARLRGAILDGNCAGRRGHHWESGDGERGVLWLGHFHRHECAKKQLVPCVRIKHVSLVR